MKKADTTNKKKLSRTKVLRCNLRLIALIWKTCPAHIIGTLIEAVVWGVHHGNVFLYTERLFNAIGEGAPFAEVAALMGFFALYLVLFWAFHHGYWTVIFPRNREKLHLAIHSKLFAHAVQIDLAKYDDPEFYNDFVFSMEKSYSHLYTLVEDAGKLINFGIGSLMVGGILFDIDPLLGGIILGISALRVGLSLLSNKTWLKLHEETNPLWRKKDYVNRIFRLPDYAKEVRTTHVRENLFETYDEAVEDHKKVISRYGTFFSILDVAFDLLFNAGRIGLMLLMLYKVMVTGEIALGGFAVALSAVWKLSWLLADVIKRTTKFHEHAIFAEKLLLFLDYQSELREGDRIAESFESLTVRGLSFSYGADGKRALNGVDLTIRKGEKIAIVGYNGAGKTTLTKLIMRLYDAEEGEILYNGKSVHEYTVDSLRGRMAAVFQDYRIFAASVAENVVGGAYDPINEGAVRDALRKSTFTERLASMKDGVNTPLTREFNNDGVQLSGGEAQKVAIARAFYQNAELIILDEPSSALDPDAEYALNEAIAKYAEGRAVIFISHRLSTTVHADRIYMFDGGTPVECGTHEELMALGGKYAYMFNLQAKKYREGNAVD